MPASRPLSGSDTAPPGGEVLSHHSHCHTTMHSAAAECWLPPSGMFLALREGFSLPTEIRICMMLTQMPAQFALVAANPRPPWVLRILISLLLIAEGKDILDFYSDANTRKLYKLHIWGLLSRLNPLTGLAPKDDPTIFSFNIINEPRCPGEGAQAGLQISRVLPARGPPLSTTVMLCWTVGKICRSSTANATGSALVRPAEVLAQLSLTSGPGSWVHHGLRHSSCTKPGRG